MILGGLETDLLLYGLLIGLCAGALGGTLAGLAGVGGGLIYVPLFYAFLPVQESGIAIHIFASLVAIIMTGFFSARAHWRLGHVDKQVLFRLLPGLICGAGLGLWSTLHLPAVFVLLGLAALDGWVARDYGRDIATSNHHKPSLSFFSLPIGYISGALGIGGGTMIVPLLRRHLSLRFAVGTSAACTLIMAAGAVLANLLIESGWQSILAAEWSRLLGLWIGIALILPLCSRWSAALHGSLPEVQMRLLLRLLFVALAMSLLLAAGFSAAS